jgi:hypothetical protein
MKTTVTCECAKQSHAEFDIIFDSVIPDEDVDWLVSILQQAVRDGMRCTHGELLELGSMLLRLNLVEGRFVIEEPDLRGIPIAWTHGVTESLKRLRLQKDVADSLGLLSEINFPTIRQSVIVGKDLETMSREFVLDRLPPEASDSGWFIGKLHPQLDYNDPSNLVRISVYQTILNWPPAAWFLALPEGTRIEVFQKGFMVFRNEERLFPRKGSLLDLSNNITAVRE